MTQLTCKYIVSAYIVQPQAPQVTKGALLFVSDALGIYENSQLLADRFMAAGYVVLLPDLFAGDAIPINVSIQDFGLEDWLARHTPAKIDPIIERSIQHLKTNFGFEKVGAVGYCLGAKVHIFRSSFPFLRYVLLTF